MGDTHAIADAPNVPTDGTSPYWMTKCGLRLDEQEIAVSSNPDDITCAECGA
jgi:hypothetical protein